MKAEVIDIRKNGILHIVGFRVGKQRLYMMSLEVDSVKIGSLVELSVKPLNISLAKENCKKTSFVNELEATVLSIESDELLSSVTLLFEENILESVLLKEGMEKLGIKEKDKVLLLIKANDIAIKEVL